ncbi:MAG TPA: hypothetical protein VL588_11845 [Bdellovibrionota bacterium]|jgi:hypothetical protein|nr:hypothetical protein [Bdellovibrionota bacterium]
MKSHFLSVAIATLALAQSAQATVTAPNMIEVGAGAAASTQGSIEALFRVNAQGAVDQGGGQSFILAKITGDAAFGSDGLTYVDMEFESLGWHWGDQNDYVDAHVLGVNVQRNVNINNDVTARFTLLGLRGGFSDQLSPDVKLILDGAIDLLSLSYTKRVSDGADLLGWGAGLQGEAGVELFDRVRITLGEKLGTTLGSPEQVYAGVRCDTYGDGYNATTICQDDYVTKWNDVRVNSSTYLSIIGQLTKSLSLFGRASYNLYSVSDQTAGSGTPPSTNGEFQFVLGATYKF